MDNVNTAPIYKLRAIEAFCQGGVERKLCDDETLRKLTERIKQNSPVKRGTNIVKDFRGNQRDLQTVQNKPFRPFYAGNNSPDHFLKVHLPIHHEDIKDATPQSKATIGYKVYTQPTQYFRRPPTEKFLIRRPATNTKPPPLNEDDILFKSFTKQLEFKLKNFPTTKEQYYFYQTNFPLLLDQQKESEQNQKITLKRSWSPENVIHPELKRGIQLKHHLFDIKKKIDELEMSADNDFETELRKGLFDPTTYPWNKKKRPFPMGKASKESRDILRKALWSPV